jgi:MoaA/NifB/PqqE/SkfB family radical SAM enzyme
MSEVFSRVHKTLHEGLHYRLRTVAGGRFASLCRPVSIVLLITENCSAKCKHCDIWKNRIREETTLEEWQALLTDLRSWLGPVHVVISGGEALMRGYTPDLVAHAHKIGLFLEILTHGYWKDQTKIERLARANPWKITMSLDGFGDTHTLVRGRPNFWEFSHNSLQTMLRLRKDEKLNYTVRLKHVLMSYNVGETVKLAKQRSCNALTTLQLQSNGDVTVCTGVPPVGNFRERPIREIWENRPHFWESGCCISTRASAAELEQIRPAPSLTAVGAQKQ